MVNIRTRRESENLMIDFRYQGVRYRQQTTLSDTPTNRHVLARDMKKIEAEIELGILDIDKLFPAKSSNEPSFTCETSRFDQFALQWLGEKQIEWKDSHYNQTESTINNYLIPTFGVIDLKSISKSDILSFRNSLSLNPGRGGNTHFSTSRINHIMSTLRQILTEAAERFEFKPVFKNVKTLRIPKAEVMPFTLDEISQILDNVDSKYKNYFTVRFFTGLRSAEINGLKWKYVDFENRKILIRETWINVKSETTKNDGSVRDVDMSSLMYASLEEQQKMTGDHEHVFTNRNGNPLDNCNLTKRIWYPLLDNLDLARRRPYQTRHTTASLWLAAGESPEWIAAQLGHTTTNMLFKVYSRYVPNLARQDGEMFEKIVSDQFVRHQH